MGFSLRDLMRREKESRKRKPESEEENRTKVPKTSQSDKDNSPKEESQHFKDSVSVDSGSKGDNFGPMVPVSRETVPESVNLEVKNEEEGNFAVPLPLNTHEDNKTSEELKRTVSEDSSDLQVVEEFYELLEDDQEVVASDEPKSDSKSNLRLGGEEGKFDRLSSSEKEQSLDMFDENRLVYEQLNTAYCSNLDYEHENILREAGVTEKLGEYDEIDSDDDVNPSHNKNVITSSNFGVSNVNVSAAENLPVGFFDDQNVDAKARGKLTSKEAKDKIKELSKKRYSYLKEAKYVQDKLLESFREKTRMENDQQDHSEALKELQNKVARIKDDLSVDTSSLKLDPDREAKVEGVLNQYSELDYDDLSWMSRSLV